MFVLRMSRRLSNKIQRAGSVIRLPAMLDRIYKAPGVIVMKRYFDFWMPAACISREVSSNGRIDRRKAIWKGFVQRVIRGTLKNFTSSHFLTEHYRNSDDYTLYYGILACGTQKVLFLLRMDLETLQTFGRYGH